MADGAVGTAGPAATNTTAALVVLVADEAVNENGALSAAQYIVKVFMAQLTKVEAVKAVQALLMSCAFSNVTDKLGEQRKGLVMTTMMKEYQERVGQSDQWLHHFPPNYQHAEDLTGLLLRSRGTAAFTAENLWSKWTDIRKEMRKAEPIWFSV